MSSRRETGGDGVRLPALSRRDVMIGSSATGLIIVAGPEVAASTDESLRRCRLWLAVTARIERLEARWARLESWLIREHRWHELAPAEQQALPWAGELRDIDGCLELLFERRDALLLALPASPAATLQAVMTRLAVAEKLVWADAFPEAHTLIAQARRDLLALHPQSHRP